MTNIKQFKPITSDFGSLIEDYEAKHDLYLEQQKINEQEYKEYRAFLREINAERQANWR